MPMARIMIIQKRDDASGFKQERRGQCRYSDRFKRKAFSLVAQHPSPDFEITVSIKENPDA